MDVVNLAEAVVACLTAAAKTYGRAFVDALDNKAVDAAADATWGLGRRLLRRLKAAKPAIAESVSELTDEPDEADLQAVVRVQVRKALVADPELAAELGAMVSAGGVGNTAIGDGSVAVHTVNGVVSTGDYATNWHYGPDRPR